jgi:hypothetical protein
MTRETKIGMAVAASFLCLVGIVVATKCRRGGEVDENVAPTPPGQAASPGNSAPKTPDKKALAVAAAPQTTNPQPQFRSPGTNEEMGNTVVPTPVNGGNNFGVVVLPPLPTTFGNNDSAVPKLPAPATFTGPANLPPTQLPIPVATGDTTTALADLINRQQEQSPPPLPANDFGKKIDNTLNSIVAKVDDAKNKTDRAVDNGFANIDKQVVNGANKGNDAINRGIDGFNRGIDTGINKVNDFLNKNVNDPANKGIDRGLDSLNKNVNDPANKGIDNLNKNIDRGLDSLNKNVNDPINKGLDNFNRNIDRGLDNPPPTTIGNAAPMNPSVPPLPNFASPNNPAPMIPQPAPGNSNALPVVTSLPPIGATPKNDAARAAIPAPMVASLPQNTNNNSGFVIPAPGNSATVMVHDMQTHQARNGETFASLSQNAYGDNKYANALQMYNRDYGPNRTVTTLQAGQTVLVPPLQFLQERYASAIGGARSNITNVSVAPVSINPPVPLPMNNNTPPLPTADATKTYRVPPEGQLMYAIALQTMGDGNRWSEIYRLNPNLQPLQPVPGGTMLRLPSNAKVP